MHRDRYASTATAVEWLREAMVFVERAEVVRPAHNDDAALRWNACVRLLEQLPATQPDTQPDTQEEPLQLE